MKKPRRISKAEFAQLGRPTEVTDTLVRFWEGLIVEDATFDLVIRLDGIDYLHAKARNRFECAFVQAARRLHGAQHAIFSKSVAYVDLVMDMDERKVYRFDLSAGASRTIQALDKTKTDAERQELAAKAGSAFVLRAPSDSFKLDARRDQSTKSRRRKRRQLLMRGTAVCVGKKKRTSKPVEKARNKYGASIIEVSDQRDATGLIQFKVGKVKPSKLKQAAKPIAA
jgi:hypothetical protein